MRASHIHIKLAIVAVLAILTTSSVATLVSASEDSGIRWKVSDTFYGRLAVASDGTVYVLMSNVNSDGSKYPVGLRALDANGNKKWEMPVTGECTDPIIDRNGTIYYVEISRSSYDSDLVAVSASGSILWKVNASATFSGQPFSCFGEPVISPDGNILVIFENRYERIFNDNRICSFSPAGSLRWDTQVVPNATIIYAGKDADPLIYAVSLDGQISGLDLNGALAWTMDLAEQDALFQSPMLVRAEGGLYAIVARKDENGRLNDPSPREVWALSSNGSVAWKFSPLDGVDMAPGCNLVLSGISENGNLYIGQQGESEMNWAWTQAHGSSTEKVIPAAICAVGPDGELQWKSTLPGNITLSFPIIVTESAAYAFTLDAKQRGGITALALNNGSLIGAYSSPTDLWVNGMAAGSGDRLYYFEGAYKGAEQGVISLICSSGLPHAILPRPLDLVAASMAWSGILGLAAVSGVVATRMKKQ